MRYAVVDTSNNTVVNVVDADEPFDPGEGYIIVASEDAQIGWLWNGTALSAPPPTVEEQADAVWAVRLGAGITINSIQCGIDDVLALAPDYIQATTAFTSDGSRTLLISSTNSVVTLTPPQLVELYEQLLHYKSAMLYARATVIAAITANTLTDYTLVEGAFDTAYDAAPTWAINSVAQKVTAVSNDLTDAVATIPEITAGDPVAEAATVPGAHLSTSPTGNLFAVLGIIGSTNARVNALHDALNGNAEKQDAIRAAAIANDIIAAS